MTSIYLQLNIHKKSHKKLLTNNQETNTTSDKFEDKTKSSLIQITNNKKFRNNYYLKRYENYFHKKLVIKYNVLPQEYNLMQLNNFVSAKYCHNLASFKEKLIYNDIEEFLKDYYKLIESKKEIPKFSEFYKSYLNFFCFPIFAELRLNDLIEEMVENKAKAFYNENYNEEENLKKSNKKNKYINDTIIFTQKIRIELSRKNTLTDLSKTTIKNNNKSNNCSLTSVNTINKIIDILGDDKKRSSFTLINIDKKKDLLNKEENKEYQTERTKKLEIESNNIVLSVNNINYNSVKDINKKKNIIKIKHSIEKDNKIKNNSNNKNNTIKIMKNQYIINQLNQQNKIIKYRLSNTKKNSKNKVVKEYKKFNYINNTNIEKNQYINNKIKINKNNIIQKLINFDNINKIKKNNNNNIINKNEKGNNTERENKNYTRNTYKINKIKLGKFDQKFQTFLKIALNFNKASPKKKQTMIFKKAKDSNISLTDRNKSNKLKNKININSCIKNNFTEYIKCATKKNLIRNKNKKLRPISRNYLIGFDDIKSCVIKTSLKNKIKDSINLNLNFNSSKKSISNPHNKLKKIRNNSKNNTQKILKNSKEKASFIKKEKYHLATINLSQLNYNVKNNKKMSNFKTINVKKTLLPLNKLIIRTMGISNSYGIKKQTTLSKIKLPII